MSKLLVRTVFGLGAICAATGGFADAAAPATTAQSSKGATLVNARGLSLYTYDNDDDGKSACTAQCAAVWPPLIAAADSSTSGDWTIISRDDGLAQWAYKGQPLYTFSKDEKPGDTNGDEVNNVWHIAKP